MGDIVPIGQRRIFELEEARKLLPTVRRVTERAAQGVERLVQRAQWNHDADTQQRVDDEMSAIVRVWSDQITRLGCEAKGLWLVDFDNGAGYYCWKYPEADVEHYHAYDDGFSGRQRIN